MPRAKPSAKVGPPCDVQHIYREWKASAGVRNVAVKRDRIFESSVGDDSGIKFVIKDAAHNELVLIPILKRMAATPQHRLPNVKDLAREMLGFKKQKFNPMCSLFFHVQQQIVQCDL